MEITKLKLMNILGLEEFEFELGKFNEISGRNGSGKTSIVEAVKAALKGGNDATLLHSGATRGEIVILLDDGTQVVKTVTPKSVTLNVFGKEGGKLPKPQGVIDALHDMLSINPISFLTAAKKDRTKALLEALPLELDPGRIAIVLDGFPFDVPDMTGHPLEILQCLHDTVFTERTGVNRAMKEKEGTLNQLQESLVEVDFDADVLRIKLEALEADKALKLEKREQYIAELTSGKQSELDAARLKYDAQVLEINTKYDESHKLMLSSFDKKYQPVVEELTTLRTQLQAAGGVMKTKELISQFEDEIKSLSGVSSHYTTLLGDIEDTKFQMLQNLPIQGLEIRDGEIYKDDVQFDRLNTATQVKIAVEVAKLRAGELKLICVDGLECLDTEQYAAFKQEALESGLQLLVTRVTDTDLQVDTETGEILDEVANG